MNHSEEVTSKNVLIILLVGIVLFIGYLLGIVAFSIRLNPSADKSQKVISNIINKQVEIIKNPEIAATQTISSADASLLTVVVNKKYKLPSDYVPSSLVYFEGYTIRSEAASHLRKLLDDASSRGAPMYLISGYRSYENQLNLYNNYVKIYGQQATDTFSARPGHSEHQTGLAVDVASDECMLEGCFGNTKAGKWLKENASNYGFVIRYPDGKESVTGYKYEPWHIRYVGLFEANFLKASGLTLDELYSVPSGDYLP